MGKLGDLVRRGLGAPVKLLLPKNPWLRLLIFAIPLLLIAAFLEPVLALLARGFDLILRTFEPLLDNPVGRVILLNILLFGVLVAAWYMMRDKLRALRSGMVLRHHLTAVGALVVDPPRSRQLFRKVAGTAHRAAPPTEYPMIGEDARIKLARLALEEGDHDTALAWLTRVREKGLPKELQRSLLQLRIQAAVGQGEVLDASVEREIREGLRRFGDDVVLLAQLCHLLRQRTGQDDEVVQLQEKIAKNVPPRRRHAEENQLFEDLLRAGEAALERGEFKRASRFARKAHATLPLPRAGCLLGRIRAAEGELKAAVKEWGATRSPEGLELIAALLDEHPGVVTPRELLESSPAEGTLLLVAREYARAGEHDRALRAARRAARMLGPLPSVTAVLSEVLAACGRHDEASRLQDEAVLRLLAPDRPA